MIRACLNVPCRIIGRHDGGTRSQVRGILLQNDNAWLNAETANRHVLSKNCIVRLVKGRKKGKMTGSVDPHFTYRDSLTFYALIFFSALPCLKPSDQSYI